MATKSRSPAAPDPFATIALKLPDVERGIACAGTVESVTYNTGGKAFLFVGAKDVRLKRANGWIKIDLAAPPSQRELAAWISESHRLIGGNRSASKPAKRRKRTG